MTNQSGLEVLFFGQISLTKFTESLQNGRCALIKMWSATESDLFLKGMKSWLIKVFVVIIFWQAFVQKKKTIWTHVQSYSWSYHDMFVSDHFTKTVHSFQFVLNLPWEHCKFHCEQQNEIYWECFEWKIRFTCHSTTFLLIQMFHQ